MRRSLFAVVVALSIVAAGCGGGSSANGLTHGAGNGPPTLAAITSVAPAQVENVARRS